MSISLRSGRANALSVWASCLAAVRADSCVFRAILPMLLVLFSVPAISFAQESGKSVWRAADTQNLRSRNERPIRDDNFVVFSLDRSQMSRELAAAPMEFSVATRDNSFTFKLPTPEGRLETFRVFESPVMSPEISAQFPIWKTYQAYGVDDPSATARFGITALGFHATILTTRGTVVIDPVRASDQDNYIVYFKDDLLRERRFHCALDEELASVGKRDDLSFFMAPQFSHGSQIRTYRLAVATTGEYTQFFGGQTPALAQVTITANRMNGVYRRDFAIGLQLVSGTNLVFPDPGTDPYSNTSSSAQLTVNQTTIDGALGSANYDVGHLFLTSDSGVAQLSSICGSSKARGLSGQNSPQGDGFDVDYVAHEIGHQIGANHTFNATNNCGSSPANARREPGSAVTIMGYAGICSSTANLQRNSIDNFLGFNQEEAINFINGNGSTCGTLSGTNQVPVVTAPSSFSIPFNTPFALTASATDGDGDTLTYSWEHNTASNATSSYSGTPDDDDANLGTGRPLMRPYSPTTSPTRYFPSLPYILDSANEPPVTYSGTSATGSFCPGTCATGEDLPSVARTINYRVTVRDGQGGVADANTTVDFVNTTTPFSVTSQNTPVTYAGNSVQAITWNVSGTTAAPINTANVRIRVSTDGGQTFPLVSAPVPNNGSVNLTIPNIATTQARIMVEAVNNIFFDVNNANITITAAPTANRRAQFDFDGDDKTDLSIFRPSLGQWWLNRSSDTSTIAFAFGLATDQIVPADFTGDQKADVAFFRPSSAQWFVLRSEDLSFFAVPFGAAGDIPVPNDYDGDGKADLAVFRPSTNTWFIQKSTGGTDIIPFGAAGDKPVVSDYDGDGRADLAIFRPGPGQWWIRQSSDGSVYALAFGSSTDRPVPGFYTADNKADVAIWRPSTGEWYVLRSEDLSFFSFPFGSNGDIPVPGDYDGDDQWDPTVFRPSTNTWFVLRSTGGTTAQPFGTAGDIPLPSAFVP